MQKSGIIFILLLLTFQTTFSQGGSIGGHTIDIDTKNHLPGVTMYLMVQDTTVVDSTTSNENGYYKFSSITPGLYNIKVGKENYYERTIYYIAVQNKQLAALRIPLKRGKGEVKTAVSDASNAKSSSQGIGKGNNGRNLKPQNNSNHVIINNSDPSSLSTIISPTEVQMAEFEVVQYQVPLIDASNVAMQKLNVDEIRSMPMRSATSIAQTVGGVYAIDGGEELYIRGARPDANIYYIDGVKVRGSTNLPKTALRDISVYTGGIPANYGDVTGGVIAVNTKGMRDGINYHNYDHRKPRKKKKRNKKEKTTIVAQQTTTKPTPKAQKHQEPEPYINPYQFNTEAYQVIYENEFLNPVDNPLSTFSIDVDVASYSNTRRFLNQGQLPPRSAVRIEEFINYFDYNYNTPNAEEPFSVNVEASACPWNEAHQLVHIGLKGYDIPYNDMPPSNLVFLIDVSGSMQSTNKLELLKRGFKLLVDKMRDEDRVAIVVYAGASGLALPSTPGSEKSTILKAISNLRAGGSTNGAEGIKLAYQIAQENFQEEGNNRVILATDGDFNVGVSHNGGLEHLIAQKRSSGVFLTVLGFGTGNYKDDKMELLADKGNGNYYYIDNISEAKKVLVTEITGTLYTIAKDVKLQIEFNPTKVKAYRLIGYENRLLAAKDFNDDTKDAGELGSGHTVTAMYELIPADSEEDVSSTEVDPLKYQNSSVNASANASGELMTLKLRYKKPKEDTSKLITIPVEAIDAENTSDNFRFSAAVASFGMLLRRSQYKGETTYASVVKMAKKAKGKDDKGYRAEFIRMVELAELLDNGSDM